MVWLELFVAGIFETVWATLMKYSHGFTKLGFSIGAVGSILVGVVLFKDALSPLTWGFVALLIIGIVGIKMTTGS